MPKVSSIEVLIRANLLAERIAEGYTKSALAAYARENWNVDSREFNRIYFPKACRLIIESVAADREYLIARQIAIRHTLIQRAISRGKYLWALAALDSEAKLYGLFDEGKVKALHLLDEAIKEAESGFSITPEKIRQIREQVYGIYDN